MSKLTLPATRPVLLSPTAYRPTDAAMTTFSWDVPATSSAHLQVSRDRSFATPLCDLPVDGLTQLTLEKALPALDEMYYWRVGQAGAWSAPAAFRGTTDEQVQLWERAQAEAQVQALREAQRAREQATSVEAEMEAPWHDGLTSRLEAALWMYPMFVGFVIVVYLLARSFF